MPRMRVINRTAVTITGAQPYLDWTSQHDADATKGQLTVGRAKPFGTTFLLPEVEFEIELREWIEENVAELFEFQLSAWTDDEPTWPKTRDVQTFFEWFRVDISSVVIDAADEPLQGEEL